MPLGRPTVGAFGRTVNDKGPQGRYCREYCYHTNAMSAPGGTGLSCPFTVLGLKAPAVADGLITGSGYNFFKIIKYYMDRVLVCGKDLSNAGYLPGPLYMLLLQMIMKSRRDNVIVSDTKQAELQYLLSKGLIPYKIIK